MRRFILVAVCVAPLLLGAAPRRTNTPVVVPDAVINAPDSLSRPWAQWVKDDKRRWNGFDDAIGNLHIRVDSVPLVQGDMTYLPNTTASADDSVFVRLPIKYSDAFYGVSTQKIYRPDSTAWFAWQSGWVAHPTDSGFYLINYYSAGLGDDYGYIGWVTVGTKP